MPRRSLIGIATLAAVLAGTPTAGQAQGACDLIKEHAMTMKVGAWAAWDMSEGTMKQAVVGKEQRDGKDHYWLEMAMQGKKKGEDVVMKMLVPGWMNMTDIKEIIVKPAGEPAMRMPAQMMGMMRQHMKNPAERIQEECANTVEVGKETVTVPAGTFSTTHYRTKDGVEMWWNTDLHFPLVKMVSEDGQMVLVDHGTGAETAITGPIEDMPGMPGF